jgi:hypothetical protein
MRLIGLAAAATCLAASPAAARPEQSCSAGVCQIKLTPTQLLGAAERLVAEGRYAEAKPLVDVLRQAPGLKLQSAFLSGLIASRTGDYASAADQFMAILANDPRQTRVRLELAQAFIALKKTASADRQLRIAQQDADLPQQVARTIRTARDTIRSGRAWRLDVNVGLAPDTNINNATSVKSVTLLLGNAAYSADLNEDAKATSGLGATAQLSTGLRLPISDKISVLAELDANGTNYSGNQFDDFAVQSATGAEYRLTSTNSASFEGTYARRWYGGRSITQQFGARLGGQMTLGRADRLGFQIDVRRNQAFFDSGYDGWQGGVYGTFEHALTRTIVASMGPFVRREWLHENAFSSKEVGGNVGIGGELPRGFNVGASVGVSRATFDAAIPLFDLKPRLDNRAVFRATVGNRILRFHGFSPQVNWTYNRISSSLGLYSIRRSRFEVTLARYF